MEQSQTTSNTSSTASAQNTIIIQRRRDLFEKLIDHLKTTSQINQELSNIIHNNNQQTTSDQKQEQLISLLSKSSDLDSSTKILLNSAIAVYSNQKDISIKYANQILNQFEDQFSTIVKIIALFSYFISIEKQEKQNEAQQALKKFHQLLNEKNFPLLPFVSFEIYLQTNDDLSLTSAFDLITTTTSTSTTTTSSNIIDDIAFSFIHRQWEIFNDIYPMNQKMADTILNQIQKVIPIVSEQSTRLFREMETRFRVLVFQRSISDNPSNATKSELEKILQQSNCIQPDLVRLELMPLIDRQEKISTSSSHLANSDFSFADHVRIGMAFYEGRFDDYISSSNRHFRLALEKLISEKVDNRFEFHARLLNLENKAGDVWIGWFTNLIVTISEENPIESQQADILHKHFVCLDNFHDRGSEVFERILTKSQLASIVFQLVALMNRLDEVRFANEFQKWNHIYDTSCEPDDY